MLSLIHEAVLLKVSKAVTDVLVEAVELDNSVLLKLKHLEQKSIQLKIKTLPFDLSYLISFSGPNVTLKPHSCLKPDLEIAITPGSLIRAKLTSLEQVIRERDIEFTGDLGLAMELQNIMHNIDFDFKSKLQIKLSEYTNDAFAWQFMNVLDKIFNRLEIKQHEFSEQLTDYLQLETSIVPNKYQVEDFCNEIDSFRDDVERLVARVERL